MCIFAFFFQHMRSFATLGVDSMGWRTQCPITVDITVDIIVDITTYVDVIRYVFAVSLLTINL